MNSGNDKLEAALNEYRSCTQSADNCLEKAIINISNGRIRESDYFLNACGYWLVMANKALRPLVQIPTPSPIGIKKQLDELEGAK